MRTDICQNTNGCIIGYWLDIEYKREWTMTTTRSKSGRKDDDQGCVQNAGLGRIIYRYNNIMYIVYIIIIYYILNEALS